MTLRTLMTGLALAFFALLAQAHSYKVGNIAIGHPYARATAPGQPTGRREGLGILDVGPSILKLYGIDPPEDAVGRSFL